MYVKVKNVNSLVARKEQDLISIEDIYSQYNLKPGTKVIVKKTQKSNTDTSNEAEIVCKSGRISDVYSRFIIVDFGQYKESFNKVDLLLSNSNVKLFVV